MPDDRTEQPGSSTGGPRRGSAEMPRGEGGLAALARLPGVARLGPLVLALLALAGLFGFWVPNFLSAENMLDLVQQVAVNAVIALGVTLTIMIGGIDLSVGAVLALVGTTAVWVLVRAAAAEVAGGLGLAVAIAAGLTAAGCFGLLNGMCAALTRMPPFIITLASMLIARGIALRFNKGQPMHVPDHETVFLFLGNGRLMGIVPIPALVMLAVFAVAAVLLHYTRFGQHVYAIGGNREAARLTGIPVARVEGTVYLLCALLAGVAGLIHTSQLYSAEPNSGIGFELSAIAAAVVGGTSFTGGVGSMFGTLIGAIIIGTVDKGLNQAGVHFSLQYIVKGCVILAAVYVDVRRRG